jgi:hypothetical protein
MARRAVRAAYQRRNLGRVGREGSRDASARWYAGGDGAARHPYQGPVHEKVGSEEQAEFSGSTHGSGNCRLMPNQSPQPYNFATQFGEHTRPRVFRPAPSPVGSGPPDHPNGAAGSSAFPWRVRFPDRLHGCGYDTAQSRIAFCTCRRFSA